MSTNFDRRRINGPEESFSPVYESDEEEQSKLQKPGQPSRHGRQPTETRPIFLKTGLINQANGSAYIETDKTKIACAIYGPRQSKTTSYNEKGKLKVEVKFAPFSCAKRRAPLRDAEDRAVSNLIQQSLSPAVRLELFPKSTIDIFLFVIENDGIEGCVAAGTMAASTALAHARIDMLGLVASSSTAVMDSGVWMDPSTSEAKVASGCLTMACIPALGLTTNLWQTGRMTIEQAATCMDLCEEQCQHVHTVMAQALLETEST